MRLLLDSSGAYLVCALADAEGVILEQRCATGTPESRDIGAMAGRVLGELRVSDLKEIVAGIGPGSFIGTRVALSYANGLAAAAGMRLRGVPSLAAIAAVYGSGRAVVLRDARRAQVYWHGPGAAGAHGDLVEIDDIPRRIAEQGVSQVILEQPPDDPRSLKVLAELSSRAAAAGASVTLCDGVPAEGLRRLAGTVPPADYVEPVYLRGYL